MMQIEELIKRIENIVKENDFSSKDLVKIKDKDSLSQQMQEVMFLGVLLMLEILKTPLRFVIQIFNKNWFSTLKKDAKYFGAIMMSLFILLIFFIVLWLTITVSVGIYFFEQVGYSMFVSISLSIAFQLLSMLLIGVGVYMFYSKIKLFKIVKKGSEIL